MCFDSQALKIVKCKSQENLWNGMKSNNAIKFLTYLIFELREDTLHFLIHFWEDELSINHLLIDLQASIREQNNKWDDDVQLQSQLYSFDLSQFVKVYTLDIISKVTYKELFVSVNGA